MNAALWAAYGAELKHPCSPICMKSSRIPSQPESRNWSHLRNHRWMPQNRRLPRWQKSRPHTAHYVYLSLQTHAASYSFSPCPDRCLPARLLWNSACWLPQALPLKSSKSFRASPKDSVRREGAAPPNLPALPKAYNCGSPRS